MKKLATLFFCLIAVSVQGSLPKLNESFHQAKVVTDGNMLTVSTGEVQRTWEWTGKGLVTISIKGFGGDKSIVEAMDAGADWDLGQIGNGKIVSLISFEGDDDGFTSRHLAVEAEIEYEKLKVKYVIWAYPGADGIRTQLWIKGKSEDLGPGVSERLKPAKKFDQVMVFVFGYQAGLKSDMKPYEILREEQLGENSSVDWASGLIVRGGEGGLVLIKESHLHNTLKKNGVETGEFQRVKEILTVTGLGLKASDLKEDEYKFCWANWMIGYQSDYEDAQMAVKRFDRRRYPVHERDIFIMANTWGTEDEKYASKYKAREENVLRELESCAEIGIDILQIDDGWQNKNWRPISKMEAKELVLHTGEKVTGRYAVYPEGFGKVRERAKELGVKLGLWHANFAPLESLKANYTEGDFKGFKLDFATLKTKEKFDVLYYKARDLIKHSDYTAVVNWDVTEDRPRMGFYFGRDCGNLYLTNRKAKITPGRERVLYDPWQVLRDGWELARYMNLNKIQLTYQNKDITPADANTDAMNYSHGYNLAITLMSSPIFFTETQFIGDAGRKELRAIIDRYKAEREHMYKGYVFAIGQKPDNASWTGFQNVLSEHDSGYLTIFRELNNKQKSAMLSLHFLKPGTKLTITDLLSNTSRNVYLNDNSEIEFSIEKAPGFGFFKYSPAKQ